MKRFVRSRQQHANISLSGGLREHMKTFRYAFICTLLFLAAFYSPIQYAAADDTSPLIGDALQPPPHPPTIAAAAGDFKPSMFQPSSFLAGRVAVQLIFVESNGKIEPSTTNWTTAQVALATGQVTTALEWWRTQLPNARIEFDLTSRMVQS